MIINIFRVIFKFDIRINCQKISTIMNKFSKLIKQSSYIFVNNKLYVNTYNNKYVRIKQRLPEFISDVEELKKYDIDYRKKKESK